MLHALALAEIEDSSGFHIDDVEAFTFEVIDILGLDEKTLRAVKCSQCKVELVFQWIQILIVSNADYVIGVAPPILSRCFQELANGMCVYHDALKISTIPFPFPYTQTCEVLLMISSVVTPFVVCQWCDQVVWAGLVAFIQTMTLWALNHIALEIENPFGRDDNDLD